MAQITDTLTTILELRGLSDWVRGMGDASAVTGKTVTQLELIGRAMTGVQVTMAELGGSFASTAAAIVIASQAFQRLSSLVTGSMRDFEQYNDTLTRTAILLGNAGRNVPVASLRNFATQRLIQGGIPETETLDLVGRLTTMGFGISSQNQLVPALQNIQASGLMNAEHAAELINRILRRDIASGGRAGSGGGGLERGAAALRLDTRYLGGGLEHDLKEIIKQINEKFGGVAQILQSTASGTFERTQKLTQAILQRLGGVIENTLAPALLFVNQALIDLLQHLNAERNQSPGGRALDIFATPFPFWGFAIAQQAGQMMNDRAVDARNQQQTERQTKDLDEIARNTQVMAGALVASVFGSASAFTRGAQTYREINAALTPRV